jgi:hypothetical protein
VPALRTEVTTQAPHDARARLAHTLLNGSCLGPARHTRLIWPSIPPQDNDGLCLSCHHLVRHSTSFLSLLMPPPPRYPILGTGRRSRRLLPVFVRHRLAQWLLHVHEDVLHHTRTIVFAIIGRPVRLSRLLPCSSSPTCCPRSQPRANRRSSTRVRGESVMLLAFLRACRRGRHGGACHT